MSEVSAARIEASTLQSRRFLLLYALAAAGGSVAYIPFLTILLPMQVSVLAGDANVHWIAYLTFFGAISASITNIAFGWLSDISNRRQVWVWAGLFGTSILLVCFSKVESFGWLVSLLVLWQCALNMLLSPLAAWAGDTVPNQQKGLLGGLIAFSPAIGALSGAFITLPGLATPDQRLWLVASITIACVLPVLLFGKPSKFAELLNGTKDDQLKQETAPRERRLVVRMWLARLLVQISEAALFAFLYFWFRSIDERMTDATVAQTFSIVLIISVPIAIAIGRWSDANKAPFQPLAICAVISGFGLIGMGLSSGIIAATVSYILFGIATTVFLSLHTGQTLRLLPSAHRRGRDLGIFNLTNTGPSLVMPWIVVGLVPMAGYSSLFMLLACFAFLASFSLKALILE